MSSCPIRGTIRGREDVDPQIADLLIRLSELAVRNSATAVNDKVRSIRAGKATEATASELQEIIDELIKDKAELVQIGRALESEFAAQRITEQDIGYITEKIIPTIELLVGLDGGIDEKTAEQLEAVKKILSVETFTILQLLGFNFKAAIGGPLTGLIEGLILSQVPTKDIADQASLLAAQREVLLLEIMKDPDATARLSRVWSMD